MKKIFVVSIFLVLMTAAGAMAQGPGMMWSDPEWNYCPYCGREMGPRGGYGHGPGMMWGGGYGMMHGYGHGPGMMWGDYGRKPGYFHQSEECQKFLDQNAGLRKELHEKRFEYTEAMRNPKTTRESLAKLEKEIRDLQDKIYSNAPQGCWQ